MSREKANSDSVIHNCPHEDEWPLWLSNEVPSPIWTWNPWHLQSDHPGQNPVREPGAATFVPSWIKTLAFSPKVAKRPAQHPTLAHTVFVTCDLRWSQNTCVVAPCHLTSMNLFTVDHRADNQYSSYTFAAPNKDDNNMTITDGLHKKYTIKIINQYLPMQSTFALNWLTEMRNMSTVCHKWQRAINWQTPLIAVGK